MTSFADYSFFIYNSIILIPLAGILFKVKDRNTALFLYTLIFFFGAIRFDVGPDYYSYYQSFKASNYMLVSPPWDYKIYIFLADYLYDFEYGFPILTSFYLAITLMFLFLSLNRENNLIFGLFIFIAFGFMFDSFDRIRQMASVAFFLWSMKFVINGDFKKYTLALFIGSFLHVSAVLLLPFYFILRSRHSFTVLLGLVLVVGAVSILGEGKHIHSTLYNLVPFYSEKYANTAFITTSASLGLGYVFNIAIMLAGVLCYRGHVFYKNGILVGLLIYITASGNLNLERFSAYFTFISVVVFNPDYIKANYKFFNFIAVILFISFFQAEIKRNYFDYNTIFSSEFQNKVFVQRYY